MSKNSPTPKSFGSDVLARAQRVLTIESQAILDLKSRLDNEFIRAVEILKRCQGKVIVIGMGKSGHVGKKLASTLASTGTPSFFVHPAEGSHGDLGMLAPRDVAIAISNSGETEELIKIVPVLKRLGIPLIIMTGKPKSTLGRAGDIVLDVSVREEACPLGLAPTASTTATLALGDALAISLLEERGFKESDFALLHPGGMLGRKLLLKVSDLMHRGKEMPLVAENTSLREAIVEMTSKRLGITGVANAQGELVGVVTDGDLRRYFESGSDFLTSIVREVMTSYPKTITDAELAAKAMHLMEKHSITALFVVSDSGTKVPLGVVHMHDLLKANII